jgi:hypothetical protein
MDANQRTKARSEHSLTLVYVLVVAVIAVVARQLPYLLGPDRHFLWHLMPVGALALFAGSRLRSPLAWLVPLAVMLASDLLLWYPLAQKGLSPFSWVGTPVVYGSYALYVLLGRLIRQGELSPAVIGGAALLGSVLFFLLTNFICWPGSSLYPQTFEGLLQCFAAGVPFYRNTLAGDLFYSGVIFGLHTALVWGLGHRKVRQPA